MTEKYIFWAQALDNSAPDHIEVRGEELEVGDSLRRQEAVSFVSRVVKSGERIFDVGGVLLAADTQHFVVEVPSVQQDKIGRTAPIVCYGGYEREVGGALGASVAVGLDAFAKRIGRSLQPEHSELIRESFEVLKKKSLTKRRIRNGAIGIVAFALVVIGYWLASRNT